MTRIKNKKPAPERIDFKYKAHFGLQWPDPALQAKIRREYGVKENEEIPYHIVRNYLPL